MKNLNHLTKVVETLEIPSYPVIYPKCKMLNVQIISMEYRTFNIEYTKTYQLFYYRDSPNGAFTDLKRSILFFFNSI